jgi:hypothetical protein
MGVEGGGGGGGGGGKGAGCGKGSVAGVMGAVRSLSKQRHFYIREM